MTQNILPSVAFMVGFWHNYMKDSGHSEEHMISH